MENWFLPVAASPLPPARQVLVLAPHPDDEVFGCGGCASLYARAGAIVHPYVLTDGGGYLTGPQRESVVALRREESQRAAAILGTQAPVFGPWQDRRLGEQTTLAHELSQKISNLQAEVVFAPSLWEVHPDHRATAWAVLQAVQSLVHDGRPAPTVAFYEVGAPLRPNHLVDISPVLEVKRAAMAAFASQLAQQRYDIHITALNTFRTYALPPDIDAAEALIVVPAVGVASWLSSYGDLARGPGLAEVTEAALRNSDASAEDLQRTIVTLAQEKEAQAEAARALAADISRLAAELDQTRQALAVERGRADSSEIKEAAARRALEDVFASRSWRLTRPLRWLAERLR